jgi:hypothetical protein
MMTMDATLFRRDSIQEAFQSLFASHPGAKVDFRKTAVHGDILLLEWSAGSGVAVMPQGVGTFIIQDDRIQRQTMWFTVVPKES